MKDSSPFGLAGLWENWRNPKTGEWERTFAIVTVPSNELVGQSTTACLRSWNLKATTGG
jgi:putative SOS response-associated peptidase YedK